MKRALLLSIALLFLVSATARADGGPRYGSRKAKCEKCADTVLRNPDARTSITLTAGLGDADRGVSNGDVTVFGAALIYPATQNFSFLASWNHSELDWDFGHTS